MQIKPLKEPVFLRILCYLATRRYLCTGEPRGLQLGSAIIVLRSFFVLAFSWFVSVPWLLLSTFYTDASGMSVIKVQAAELS